MIEGIGNAIVALDAAHREDIELLHHQRKATANTYAALIADLVSVHKVRTADHEDFVARIKTAAGAEDSDFAKAIARRESMLGEPAMQYQGLAQAAE